MAFYRLYFVRDGHIVDRQDFHADDDSMACIVAKLASDESPEQHDGIELWDGDRQVPREAREETNDLPEVANR